MHINYNSVTLVGAIPDPIGGVSTYCYRLLTGNLRHFYIQFFDLYPRNNKTSVPVPTFLPKYTNSVYKFFWLSYFLFFKSSKIIHFNFSSTNSLLAFFFIPKNNRKWFLMLHNGELKLNRYFSRFLVKYLLNKFDKVFYISEKQRSFYSCYLPDYKLFHIDSYLPPTKNDIPDLCQSIKDFLGSFSKNVLGSGYALPFYNLEYLLNAAEANPTIGFIVVIYGNYDHSTLKVLEDGNKNLNNFKLLTSMGENQFLALVRQVDVYVRPNSIDSFGIACADSILLNTHVVASDVCARFPGVHLFQTDDYIAFSKELGKIINLEKPDTDIDLDQFIISKVELYRRAYYT